MATILMAWELGEGLGHVQRLLRIARPLAQEGHRLVFALCDVVESWHLFQKERFPILQSPIRNPPLRRADQPFVASSFADVLFMRGWETPGILQPLVEAWQQLVDHVSPQLIVTDFAPSLCLAAYKTVPVVQVGNWFTMAPVRAATFPVLVQGQPPMVAQSELLGVAQEVQRQRGRPVPTTLTGIFAAGDRFPTFFAELDPYQADRGEPIWDPLEPMPRLMESPPASRFFAYLSAVNLAVEPILTQMALTGCKGDVYLRSATREIKERLRLKGLNVLDEPANLDEMLARSTVIVHHGGSMANSAFAAGRPQILVPQHLEQSTTAQMLVRHGVGAFLGAKATPESAGRTLKHLMTERHYFDNAMACARRLHARPRRPGLPEILKACRAHL